MAEANKTTSKNNEPSGFFDVLKLQIQQVPGLAQLLLFAGIALTISIGVALALWAQKEEYTVLFTHLDDANKAQVVQALQQMQTDYQINPKTGDVLVPQSQRHWINMQLANEGISPMQVGIEMVHGEQNMGVSQFMEGKRYHHALETELSRSIAALYTVSKARVHLALPKNSSFIRQQQSATASVLLHLLPGKQLNHQQVQAILHLVASSVPSLSEKHVSVIDQRGNLLSSKDDTFELSNKHFEYQNKLEQKYIKRIEALLAPLVGIENISAQVSINMDFSHHEETQERYNPENMAVRSEHTQLRSSGGNTSVSGVPGSLSNQPVTAKNDTNKNADAEGSNSGHHQVKRNYEIDKTLTYRAKNVGEILRVSAAVIINQPVPKKAPIEGDQASDSPAETETGNAQTQQVVEINLSDEEIAQLVKDAIGFNELRGDSVSIEKSYFLPTQKFVHEEPSFLDKLLHSTTAMAIARYSGAAFIILLLVFKVIKPTIQSMLTPAVVAKSNDDGTAQADTNNAEPLSYEDKLKLIRQRVAQDPMMASKVVKSWVTDS